VAIEAIKTTSAGNPETHGEPPWLAAVKVQVSELRFGVVQLVVHEGRVVQIERTEKIRFDAAGASGLPRNSSTKP